MAFFLMDLKIGVLIWAFFWCFSENALFFGVFLGVLFGRFFGSNLKIGVFFMAFLFWAFFFLFLGVFFVRFLGVFFEK